MKTTSYAIVLSIVLTAAPAVAANMLTNPDFDTDLTGWHTFASWSGEDWEESLSSGSATITNDIPSTSAFTIVEQCVTPATMANGYHLSGYLLNPSGQSGSGYGKLAIVYHSEADCTDLSFMSGADTPNVQQTGIWEQVEVTAATPVGALSIRVDTYVQKIGAPGAVQIYVDHVVFEPQAEIFSNGFELGNLEAWSAVEPPLIP